jgi:hypothetical protein
MAANDPPPKEKHMHPSISRSSMTWCRPARHILAPLAVALLLALASGTLTASAAAATSTASVGTRLVVRGDVAPATQQAQAAQLASLAPWLKNQGSFWLKWFVKTATRQVGRKAVKSVVKWRRSGGTRCDPPFPKRFCQARPSARRPMWGLGTALSYNGSRPGVWNRPTSPRRSDAYGLTAGSLYWLTCWTRGDRVSGPGGSSDLWYRLINGGYAADVWLYTGTDLVIPGVQHC